MLLSGNLCEGLGPLKLRGNLKITVTFYSYSRGFYSKLQLKLLAVKEKNLFSKATRKDQKDMFGIAIKKVTGSEDSLL